MIFSSLLKNAWLLWRTWTFYKLHFNELLHGHNPYQLLTYLPFIHGTLSTWHVDTNNTPLQPMALSNLVDTCHRLCVTHGCISFYHLDISIFDTWLSFLLHHHSLWWAPNLFQWIWIKLRVCISLGDFIESLLQKFLWNSITCQSLIWDVNLMAFNSSNTIH